MNPFIISIIIPVYNVQDYIVDCLESVAAQTFTRSVECIVIDDCGNDDSMMKVRKFVEGYKGGICFRIIGHEQNRGLSAARNTGIINARGEYLLFIDSDDFIYPNCLMYFLEMSKKYPDAEMIAAGAKTNAKKRKRYTMEKSFPDYANNPKWIASTLLLRGGRNSIPGTAWNRLVKRDFILQHQLFFHEGILHEDEMWKFMLAPKLSCVAFCRHDTYFYRIRPQSIMTSFKSKDDNALFCLPIWHEMLDHLSPELEREQILYLWHFINSVSPTGINRTVRKETRSILWRLARKSNWPTSFFIYLYLMPPVFYIKFIRRLVAKMSNIRVSHLSPTLPSQ